MKKITTIKDIDYKNSGNLLVEGTVISIDNEGDKEKKKPFKLTLKCEDSGENFQVFSWKFDLLETAKGLVASENVYKFEIIPSLYRDTEAQIRLASIEATNIKSTKKVLKSVNSDQIRGELFEIVKTYINSNGQYASLYNIIDELIFKNEKFWKWPAATKVHHAYPGGLAKHTLNTTKNAINIWKTYSGSNMNIALIVAGAVLHDIGKLMEYNADCSRTIYGDLIPHPISGYGKVFNTALKLGIDPEKDLNIILLLNILISHHELLEYGASTKPHTLEAFVVARSDALDALIDGLDTALTNTEINTNTNYVVSAESSVFKWHH